MTEKKFKQVCKCEKCGNEAEMVITCALEPEKNETVTRTVETKASVIESKSKTKGHAVCSHCGGEADIWLDL